MSFEAAPYVRRTNYYETDKMGIVHHSNYIRWFEEARLDFMRQAGLRYTDMESKGILMPVTEVSCKYKASIIYDEEVKVRVKPTFFNGVRATFAYEIYSLDSGELAVAGTSSHCFIDVHTREPLYLKRRYPEFYEKAIKLLSGEENGSEV